MKFIVTQSKRVVKKHFFIQSNKCQPFLISMMCLSSSVYPKVGLPNKTNDVQIPSRYAMYLQGLGFSINLTHLTKIMSPESHCNNSDVTLTTHDSRWRWILNYCKIASSNTSRLEAHIGLFRLLMKGIFGPYVLWPFDKK